MSQQFSVERQREPQRERDSYLFWIPTVSGYFGTRRAYGPNIYVNRTLEVVLVFTADLPVSSADMTLDNLMRRRIAPAIK